MVIIVEIRISGLHAERVINFTSFERSHRVESIGFSGGIWILWQETINIKGVANHA